MFRSSDLFCNRRPLSAFIVDISLVIFGMLLSTSVELCSLKQRPC